jgi:hypothetical protein
MVQAGPLRPEPWRKAGNSRAESAKRTDYFPIPHRCRKRSKAMIDISQVHFSRAIQGRDNDASRRASSFRLSTNHTTCPRFDS